MAMYRLRPHSIVLAFALGSCLWILGSDRLADRLFGQVTGVLIWVHTLKGWFYVAVASLFLYGLIRRFEADWRRKEEALRASEETFRLLFEASPLPMALVNPQGGIELLNSRFVETFGYAREELPSLGQWWVRAYPDETVRAEAQENWTRGVLGLFAEGADPGPVSWERVCARADGTRRNVVFVVARVGQRLLVVFHDVTATRASEAALRRTADEKVILLKEMHHRVKNNLQIIVSLLRLQEAEAASPEDRILFAECQNRILAMALVHEELYRSEDLSSVRMEQYLAQLVERLLHAVPGGPDLELSLEEAALPVTCALPCGLVVTEMVVNALRHGRPASGRPTLRVVFRRTGAGYEARVEDNGPGMAGQVLPRPPKTLGLTLAVSLAEQLGGRLDYRYENGACFILAFPERVPADRPVPRTPGPGRMEIS